VCGNLLVGSVRISFTCGHRVYLKLPPRMFFKERLITVIISCIQMFFMIMFNVALNAFHAAETLIIFYIPLL
jgi:hypothetical protein